MMRLPPALPLAALAFSLGLAPATPAVGVPIEATPVFTGALDVQTDSSVQSPGGSASGPTEHGTAAFSYAQRLSIPDGFTGIGVFGGVLEMTGAPVVIENVVDLGFQGQVPFTVTIDSFSIASEGDFVGLGPTGGFFAPSPFFGTAQFTGTLEIFGDVIPLDALAAAGFTGRPRQSLVTPVFEAGQITALTVRLDVGLTRRFAQIFEFTQGGTTATIGVGFTVPAAMGPVTAPAVIPEPGTLALVALGLAITGGLRRLR